MTDEDWNDLHGFDVNGVPKQRFVWEGPGEGPPTRKYGGRAAFTLWYVDPANSARGGYGPHIKAVVKHEEGQWLLAGPGDNEDWFREVLEPGTPYADAIRQITVMVALRGDFR